MNNLFKDMWNRVKRQNDSTPIEIFVRHCYASSASAHKERFPGFSREKCYRNLISTLNDSNVHITFFLDTAKAQKNQGHFLKEQQRFPVIDIHAGIEAGSFLTMLEYVLNQNIKPDTIVYFLEDDYIHKPEWVKILREGFTVPEADYITLFDHKDKYLEQYRDVTAHIFQTSSCHWRTTPSTTNTYAMRFKTLQRDADIHRHYSLGRSITADHEKFCALAQKKALLISAIPGWSTHVEPKYASPCTDWENLLKETIKN